MAPKCRANGTWIFHWKRTHETQTIKTLANGLEQNPLAGKLWIVEKGPIRLYQQDDQP